MSANPFAALLDAEAVKTDDDEALPDILEEKQREDTFQKNHPETIYINNVIEKVFYFTINRNSPNKNQMQLIYLEELACNSAQIYLDLDLLEQAVFERILLTKPENYVFPKTMNVNAEVAEKKIVTYLYGCYCRLKEYDCDANIKSAAFTLIVRNIILSLKQPDLFADQNIIQQLYETLKESSSLLVTEEFFNDIEKDFDAEGEITIARVFMQVLDLIHNDSKKASLVNIEEYVFTSILIFAANERLADILLYHSTPSNMNLGKRFGHTLLGSLLNLSILPKRVNDRYEYFDRPFEQTSSIIENNLWTSTKVLNDKIFRIFMKLLKCSKKVKHRTLIWLSKCLKANTSRGKLWNAQNDFNPAQFANVCDGFMINLAYVLLNLCEPFCSNINSEKILKVDPTYCAVTEKEQDAKGVHMYDLSTETCLIPTTTSETDIPDASATRLTATNYSFVTECFFLAHRVLDLGFRVSVDHLVQMNQDIGQIQRAYNDAINQATGQSDFLDTIKTRLEQIMTKYRSLRATLLEPNFLALLSQFNMATAVWLAQVNINYEIPENESTLAPLKFRAINFPLPTNVPDTLQCIPEFVVENTVNFLSFLRRFHPQGLEGIGYESLDPILTMVLVFMGSPQRMRNPHLRARMAECLEALLPYHKEDTPEINPIGRFQRERLFKEHPYRKEIVRNLLDVFVGIEMTGQSVQFEQKFNYRKPMYVVMDYLWQLEEHRGYFKQLALEAEENMDAVSPPLFLRFVNLLMNDAVFLLDESLSNMAQLRTMQTARENGEWTNLPQEERTQNLSYIQHIGMLARFDNILGRETIHTLEFLTSEITTVFTHASMVDRIASMLNYFLLNLVGPNKKNLKVKDQKDYEFDPANTVLNICKIYVNLSENNAFCLAVSQDGRSYSPQLFPLAEDVLARIGGGVLMGELEVVARKVTELAQQQEAEEEALADAPEEFLDPIMSTLMTDPVILPSSNQIVDRVTIARHLLSDQSDPFNRSPLTMDQVIPHEELSNRIKQWIVERHKQKK